MSGFRDAASFLTRLPLHRNDFVAGDMSAAVPWFGMVGLVLGALQGAIYVGLSQVATAALAAALAVAVTTQITGAFHHDGLADMADAFGGGWNREQRLEILKDSRLGTYGVTTLLLVLIIEVSALSAMQGWVAFGALVAAHGVSRTVASLAMIVAPTAKDSGLGVDYVRELSQGGVTAAALAIALTLFALFGLIAVPIIGAGLLAGWGVVQLSINKIGGISGDVLGAIQQVVKIITLVGVAIAADAAADSTLSLFTGGLIFGP